LEQMVAMTGMGLPVASIRSHIASAITLILQLQRLPDGRRRLISVEEIRGSDGDVIQMQEIFKFVKEKTDAKGMVIGHFTGTGVRPQFLAELVPFGIEVPPNIFEPDRRL
jgi:pilus assembly protein CpaF